HRCSFCNQKTISGSVKRLTADDVHAAVETALKGNFDSADGEIAFFGGSFTAIERGYMVSLLEAGYQYVKSGLFKGIRISTRPDCIDEEILSLLSVYGVSSIELGCQSMSDKVLMLNGRGHGSQSIIDAAALIKKYGFEFGVQMMTGLYGDDDNTAIQTAEKLIALKPDTARIYPTIVLENTHLAALYMNGEYKPQTLDEAVALCSKLLGMFHDAGIKVIRLGLHSGGSVEEGYLAGAYHPAFRELCESRIYFERLVSWLREDDIPKGEIVVTVSGRYISQLVGQSRSNIKQLERMGYKVKIKQDNTYKQYQINIQGSTR
ncbi:MAG: radical SAM protein, partial [Faecalibacterium sp.]|nr:radical SAM protein [Faecalibacterium sp.]